MGMLALNRLLSLRRDSRRRRRHHRPQIRARCGLIASTGKRKTSPCQQDDYDGDSQAGKIMRNSIPDLPEDILFRIQSFMSMREAARAACVSRAFLHSWRCHPNLIFNKDTIGLKRNAFGENFHGKIGRILRNHSGISLKTFQLDYSGMCGFDGTSYLDSWLQIALKPEIEELTLFLPETNKQYSFPCSLLSDGVRDSLRYIKLRCCALHPTPELGPLRSLSNLHLLYVSITWAELECLLSNSLALEHLELNHCKGIICLKIPCTLQQLSSLNVVECSGLKVIESKAPNLSSLFVRGSRVNFSLVETLQIKKLDMGCAICDARAKLPSIMPNLETLVIESGHEMVDAPMLPTKFLYLKHLTIHMITGSTISRPYDYFSLVTQVRMVHESIFTDSQLRHIPGHRHGHLKSVKITGFSSAKSLVELTCYILNNAVSLECLTLDTIYGSRCDQDKYRRCFPMIDGVLTEAPRGLAAIRTYIEDKVPSTVNLTVLEPCSRCHVRRRG
uniref:Uncharacterized protein n=1 Tax=Oryza meridionalis TaxID=40149 RepID=A0A0E0DF86_9ORYZ